MRDDVEGDVPLWRRLLLNRFVLVPASIVVAGLIWNAYVSFHNDGIIQGLVADAAGRPVVGADVILPVQNVTTFTEKARTKTGPDGIFRITSNPSHRVQIFAESPSGRSERRELRLWFQGQNTLLDQPLVVGAGAG
jgi:Carboxypeptidase regulatory-like domain